LQISSLDMSAPTDSMAVDAAGSAADTAHSDEWQLLPTAKAAAAANSTGAGPRLSALLDHAPQFPKLPPHDLFVYGSEAMARKRAEAEGKVARQSEVEREGRQLSAAARAAQRAAGPDADEAVQDILSGASALANPATAARAAHRVRFRRADGPIGADGMGSNPLYDDEEEKEEEPEDDATVARASSPPDDDAGPDEIAALPHDNKAVRRGFAAAAKMEEDPLYDPLADDEDEAWMRAKVQRQPFQPKRQQRKNGPGAMATAASAAAAAAAAAATAPRPSVHLSCPACFTPLCFDCQRHATRPTCFRAMFVSDDVLVDKGRQVRPEEGTDDDPSVKYYAALCRTCKSHVGVMDSDEVFHFFKSVAMRTNAHAMRLACGKHGYLER
jgi:hypothetical protein